MTMQQADQKPPRAIVAAGQLSSVSDAEFDASLTELRQLAKTLGFQVVGSACASNLAQWRLSTNIPLPF
jgi:50S ribosomal subunit-associated GTPase HflX